MASTSARFQPNEMLRALEAHGVRYVVIGNLGAMLHGSPLFTGDVDICPAHDRDTCERLADALRGMAPRLRDAIDPLDLVGEELLPCDASVLQRARMLNLSTRFGDLDLVFHPDGTQGYEDLERGAVSYELDDGLVVRVASLQDIIRSKSAAGREKDRGALPVLRALLAKSLDQGGGSKG